jgi:hypothetical protein
VDPYGIVVIGERVLVAGGRDGLAVLDLFSPPLNVLASPTQTPGNIDLRVDGPAGASVRLQRSTDLINWQDWQPVTLGYLPTPISDAIGTGSSQRFYRAVKP